ncbi:alpha/beta hydrolase family protein [Compostibacter hankyongensis]|uniref:Alpha/beta hydrolase family protein n=1 Tax=Compostibacter hankyongensis TaxID=1007089 RepID=A0ABP8FZI5_9BACT
MKKLITAVILLVFVCRLSYAARVDTIRVYSAAMHKEVPCVIVRPDVLLHGRTAGTHLPVVYLLHGHSGNYADWISKVPALKDYVDLYHIIVVCPDGGFDSWYLDSPVTPEYRYETFVSKELISYVDAHYPTIPDRAHRAITGLSMGGHGALFLAFRHTDRYGAAGSMSGGVDLRPFPDNWNIKGRLGTLQEHPERWEKNSVVSLADSLKNGELKIAFECGVKDFFITVNRNLHKKLVKLGIDHDYTERPGQHTWEYWSNALPYQLLFFHRFFAAAGVKTR